MRKMYTFFNLSPDPREISFCSDLKPIELIVLHMHKSHGIFSVKNVQQSSANQMK
jgi:hypothetical protein